MKRFNGTRSSWLLRQAEYLGENNKEQAVWEMDAILPKGRELVLKPFEVVSDFQVLPPKDSASVPMCFERAVIGLGSQCGLSYCANSTPAEVYLQYRDQIQEYYWPTPERWSRFLYWRQQQQVQEHGKSMGRKLASTKSTMKKGVSPTKCLETARYYGFEENARDSRNSSMSTTEPANRRGVKDPDMVDSQLQNRERPVVAIIERHGTRAVLNMESVIKAVIQSKHFRLKVVSYDHGCGIPETAYLMRDINILISTHGNALGGSLWMPSPLASSRDGPQKDYPLPVVISIDSTKYFESWFQWTTTSMSQRFILHRCGPNVSYHPDPREFNESVCPFHRNLVLARKVLKEAGLVFDSATEHEDLLELTGIEYPIGLLDRYSKEDEDYISKMNMFLAVYWKALERYADPDRLLQLLEKIRIENVLDGGNHVSYVKTDVGIEVQMATPRKRKSYLDVCREGRCCGPTCEGIMNRNVVGGLRAYDQDMSAARWGEYHWSEEQNEFKRSGESLRSWRAVNP
jgi:hypothetical protein